MRKITNCRLNVRECDKKRERKFDFARALSCKHSSTVVNVDELVLNHSLNHSSSSFTRCSTLKFELKVISIYATDTDTIQTTAQYTLTIHMDVECMENRDSLVSNFITHCVSINSFSSQFTFSFPP